MATEQLSQPLNEQNIKYIKKIKHKIMKIFKNIKKNIIIPYKNYYIYILVESCKLFLEHWQKLE